MEKKGLVKSKKDEESKEGDDSKKDDPTAAIKKVLQDVSQKLNEAKITKYCDIFENFTVEKYHEASKMFFPMPGLQLCKRYEAIEMPDFIDPSAWLLEDCFKMLIQQDSEFTQQKNFEGCDMDIMDNFNETLINHAIKTFKNRSLKLLLKKGCDFEFENENGITPIG